jgi:hypothetical protein
MRHVKRQKMSSSSSLEYIITHVFLPPKLPQEDDSDPKQDLALTEQFRAALRSFQARLPGRERRRWVTPILTLSKMLELRDASGDMLSEKVELFLEAMQGTGMQETMYCLEDECADPLRQTCSPFTSAARMRVSSSEDYRNNSRSSPLSSPQQPKPL